MVGELPNDYSTTPIAIYGLGTETERFLKENREAYHIVGLLDGFKEEGELYGLSIIPLLKTVEAGVRRILVIARPGSCKAIAKRIGDFCREHEIELVDIRGKDLLQRGEAVYDFSGLKGESKQALLEAITNTSVVSFDLFDTLIMRRVMAYTDIFELVDIQLRERNVLIPDLPRLRLAAEKELSKSKPPTLEEIYAEVLKNTQVALVSAEELAALEWETDRKMMLPRKSVCEVFRAAIKAGKKVVVTTDTYYHKEQIASILEAFGLNDYAHLFVSCEEGTAKPQELFERLLSIAPVEEILHIGDDEMADIESAGKKGINTFRILSAVDLFDALGTLGTEPFVKNLSDRVRIGIWLANALNDPFVFDLPDKKLSVKDTFSVGYLFCAPMITDFVIWMKRMILKRKIGQVLFCARDGYLIEKLYRMIDTETKGCYFHTSRTAAIRAGVDSPEDIDYVFGMKFSGTPEEALRVRFGIRVDDVSKIDGNALILEKARNQKENYMKYINKLGIGEEDLAMFDFVAKGTTQMYLKKLFPQHIKGFYFLQLEPEFMADKGLDIEPFYTEEEKNDSAIFDNYYILETMLTAPYPQMQEMDNDGNPVYVEETRPDRDLRTFERAQNGITTYFKDYLEIVPESARQENKKLDEILLALVNRVQILDEDFLSLKVEDPFFGRMTDIKDVIGK